MKYSSQELKLGWFSNRLELFGEEGRSLGDTVRVNWSSLNPVALGSGLHLDLLLTELNKKLAQSHAFIFLCCSTPDHKEVFHQSYRIKG